MSIIDYELAKRIIAKEGGGEFIGPRSEGWIVEAERILNIDFPQTYRRFLLELGCGGFRGEEFYGIVDADLLRGPVPNGIWLTLDERRMSGLPSFMVIIQSGGDGGWRAIDISRNSSDYESPVVRLDVNCRPREDLAEDFGRFFLERIMFLPAG